MNKKNLSVVMAGAMLATSVAPVLADTTTQKDYVVNGSNKGLLIKELRSFINSKIFADVKENAPEGKTNYAGRSVYCAKINGTYYDNKNFEALETAIQNANAGTVISILDRGHVVKNGKYYAYTLEDTKTYDTYTKESLKEDYTWWTGVGKDKCKAVIDMNLDEENGTLTVKTRKAADESTYTELVYKVGDTRVDFKKPVDKDGEIIAGNDFSTLEGFAKNEDHATVLPKGSDIEAKPLYTVTISDVDNSYTTTLSKLYDGLFLTENGQKLIDTLKEYDSNSGWTVSNINEREVDTTGNGIYTLKIELTKPVSGISKTVKNEIIITSNNEAQLKLFAEGMKKQPTTEGVTRKFPVQVLAGSNRYETAVKVAKENADIKTVAENGNIVLVNGNSLVDGLAAAPLAASVKNVNNTIDGQNYAAPILLTDANGIPKATKDYMKEIIAEQKVGALDQVTIYLVGGESVISKSVENDLKEIGFRVVRAGGNDREETSLKVAELMYKDGREDQVNKENAFLVGANGEADAMSIASVASATKTPIIVESVHGIKEDTVEFLKGYKNTGLNGKAVTIIGGETTVSSATENELKSEELKVDRLAGSNRKETNAKVIDAYYGVTGNTNGVSVNPGHKFDNVVVAKDGMKNKFELIDALTATSLAARDYAPIVLGTDSLSKSQINTLEKNASRNNLYVYQVGHGVARNVVKTIAERIGLAK